MLENIIKRLDDNKQEKESLARYLTNYFEAEKSSFFIESGSTLAYFAKYLSEKKDYDGNKPKVITNNFFVQTLLLEVFPELTVTTGYLRKDYLSYVPFFSENQLNNASDRDQKIAEINLESIKRQDRITYKRLDSIISLSDVIYMTASTFGFLVGPSTRSRDNAIFKYCLLNNTARRPIKFCITEPKVFRNSKLSTIKRYFFEDEPDTWSIFKHFRECCFIFDIQLLCDSKENCCLERENRFRLAKTEMDLAIDGIIYKEENRLCRHKINHKCPYNPSDAIHFRSAPTELGLDYINGFMGKDPIFGVYDTWLNYLNGQPKNNIELIIGCESEKIKKDLIDTVNQANEFICSSGYKFQYNLKTDIKKEDENILHLQVG